MKKKFKIAIFSDFNLKSGGAYNEANYLSEKIFDLADKSFEFVLINTSISSNFNTIKDIKKIKFHMNLLHRFICYLRNFNFFFKRFKKFFFKNKFEKFIDKNKIDLIIFTGPSQYSLYLEKTDFIITIPDIGHMENNEFPEWSKDGEFDRREKILINSKKAFLILTNAEIIAKKLINKYGFENNRLKVISQTVPAGIKKNSKIINIPNLELPKKYIFYPAMYLPHKNHKYIIDTINHFKLKNKINLSAVFCGDDKGYLGDLKQYTKNLNLDNKVLFLNFVSNEQISFLYKNCFALTMPTFSGPTNIPPWEAFYHKKPVFYSSIFDIDKEYKDSVFYIDPLDENTLINGLEELYNNNSLYNIYCQKGDAMIKKNLFEKQVGDLIIEIKNLRKIKNSWKFYYDI
jgi:glycosyltransferase involved in cell wall biosynthesis